MSKLINALSTEATQEPVAVVDHRKQNGVTWLKVVKGKTIMPEHNTLLYTHPPLRELSDEEIKKIFYETIFEETICSGDIDFARAILRKASEK